MFTRRIAVTLTFAAACGVPGALAAQQTCPAGQHAFGHIGVTALECPGGGCVIAAGIPDGSFAEFRTEPRLTGVDPYFARQHGLREGDVLVAVGGELITTREGGRRWANLVPGERVTLRVRRGDREIETAVTPVRACGPVTVQTGTARVPLMYNVRGGQVTTLPPATRVRGAVSVPFARAGEAAGTRALIVSDTPHAVRVVDGVRVNETSHLAVRVRSLEAARAATLPAIARSLPEGWLGFALECEECGMVADRTGGQWRWSFTNPPTIRQVEAGSPAGRAGIRRGDRIVRVNGLDITTEEGARAFSAVRPDERVRLHYTRDGATLQVDVVAESKPSLQASVLEQLGAVRSVPPARAAPVSTPMEARAAPARVQGSRPLRYSGSLANAQIEVRSPGGVVVTETVPGEEIEIMVGDAVVRIRLTPPPR